MKRIINGALALLAALLAAGCPRPGKPAPPPPTPPRPALNPADWATFKTAFLRPEGRIIDNFNGGVSHSEGQGYGMLLAEAFDDRPAFDQLWNWTRQNLQTRPGDKLLSWRWRPDADNPTTGRVDDPNNAADGDLLAAWALARAADRWKEAAYADAARAICRDVRAKLLRPSRFGPVLLPGVFGFEKPDGLVLNPSYWVFPAFPALAAVDPDPVWSQLAGSGLALLREARFGAAGLPPDWLLLPAEGAAPPRPAPDQPPVFGYNAVRVPLYLLWSRREDAAGLLAPFRGFWSARVRLTDAPATLDLQTNQPGPDPGMAGARAIGRWLLGSAEPEPPLRAEDGYYSGALLLLTQVARAEAGR